MKTVFLLIAAILFLTNSYLSAQNLRHDARPTVTINGNMLQNPWTGGANSPVFAEIDLNSDGKIDLITFDASGNRLSLYLNGGVVGQSDYVYAPQYFSKFPIMRGWVRTYDYDCDGDLDLMTYGNGGIMVYRNDFDTTGIHFSLATNQINTYYGSILTNLYVNQVVIPSFVDVDGDGDMDILDPSIGGTWIELHKNYAMDSTGNCSGFLFHVETHTPSFAPEMWGHFYMSSIGNYATLGIQRPLPIAQTSNLIRNIDDPSSSLSGGTALCAFDYGCDNDIDLLHGDQNGTNLLFLQNGAPPDSMISQDNLFPSYDIPVLMQGVACPGYIDLNNDGIFDFQFLVQEVHTFCPTHQRSPYCKIISLNSNLVVLENTVKKITDNTIIGSNSVWGNNNLLSSRVWGGPQCSFNIGGLWGYYSTGKIGLKLNVSGQIFYGWVSIFVHIVDNNSSPSASITIYSYAYNSIPNQSILAGETSCAIPTVTLSTSGSLSFCVGDSVTLTANGTGYQYQWRKGGVNISGATKQTYAAKIAGIYRCNVTNSCGSKLSGTKTVTVNCKFENEIITDIIEHLTIYPNAATNSVTIKIPTDDDGEISVSNLFGQIIYSEKVSTEQTQIDVTQFPTGIYFIRWSSGENSEMIMFSVIK